VALALHGATLGKQGCWDVNEPERRDEAGRRESDHLRMRLWVFNELIPKIESEEPEPDTESVAFLPQQRPPMRRVRIGEHVYDVPDRDE